MEEPVEMQFCWVMKSGLAFQMNSQTIRRLVRKVTCPFFASRPPQISQSSEIFSWCCKIQVLMLGALQKSTALRTLETVSKRKGFFPQQPWPQMALQLSLLFQEGELITKAPGQGKRMIFHSATSNQQNERGVCIWKNSRKHLAQF